jgi:hypothetical protein
MSGHDLQTLCTIGGARALLQDALRLRAQHKAREDAFHADLITQLAAARKRAVSERERLIRILGLLGSELAFKLPQTLPVLPSRPRNLVAVETEAIRRRVDLQIARIEADTLAKSYGLTKATRFINLLEVSLGHCGHVEHRNRKRGLRRSGVSASARACAAAAGHSCDPRARP